MMNKALDPGIYPMLYAFFGENGELRHEPFIQQAELCLANGAAGIAILGLGTEAAKLSTEEREATIATVSDCVSGRCPLIVTIRGESPAEQIAAGERALELGATAILLQPPTEVRQDADLLRFFSKVVETLPCRIGIQNAPEFLGYGLSVASLIELAERHENFSIAKLECAALDLEPVARALGDKTLVFNGRCGLEATDNFRAGALGLIPGTETVDHTAAIHLAFQAGDFERAEEIYRNVLPVLTFIMQGIPQFLSYGKALLAMRLGIAMGPPRNPWLAHTSFGLKTVDRYANELGPFKHISTK